MEGERNGLFLSPIAWIRVIVLVLPYTLSQTFFSIGWEAHKIVVVVLDTWVDLVT